VFLDTLILIENAALHSSKQEANDKGFFKSHNNLPVNEVNHFLEFFEKFTAHSLKSVVLAETPLRG
jgi:hypothetical protein